MALTKGFKIACVSVVSAGLVAGYAYWKGHHVPAPAAIETIDTGNASPTQPEPQPETATQPPVYVQQEAQPAQQATTDASSNRGMQFLLNQGKK